jgi:hypothetical protein
MHTALLQLYIPACRHLRQSQPPPNRGQLQVDTLTHRILAYARIGTDCDVRHQAYKLNNQSACVCSTPSAGNADTRLCQAQHCFRASSRQGSSAAATTSSSTCKGSPWHWTRQTTCGPVCTAGCQAHDSGQAPGSVNRGYRYGQDVKDELRHVKTSTMQDTQSSVATQI